MNLSNILPNFKNVVFDSFNEERSSLYGKNAYELFYLQNLEVYREEQHEFENKLKLIPQEDLNDIRKEAFTILSEKKPNSPFGFYYGDFGRSLQRLKKNSEILKKAFNGDTKNAKICELGSSIGSWTALWFLHNAMITPEKYRVCDIIPDYCRFLSLLGFKGTPINLAREDLLKIINEDYDIVIITEVLEHMATDKIAFNLIEQAMSLIVSGGSLVISYPRDVGRITADVLGHQHQPSKKAINQAFSSRFEETIVDFDGSREFHLFKGFLRK